jgi:hypothetical protein
LFSRLEDSFLWAFNLARGNMRFIVIAAALFVIGYTIWSFFGKRRTYTLFGLCWFLVALSPMLGIVGYFGPYYLFLPLAGIALIVGECFDWTYKKVGVAGVCVGLAPFIVAARLNAQSELYTNTALGYAGRIAGNSARDLKRFHPQIPRGATVYIVNPDQPNLTRFFGINGLIKLLYDDDSIDVRYSSLGHVISDDALNSGKLIVMRYVDEGLVPEDTDRIASLRPKEEFQYETSDRFTLDVFPKEVAAGKGAYTIRLSGAPNTDAELQYRFNDGPIAHLTVHLNPNSETRFFVSNETKRGTYRFIAMRIPPKQTWIRANATITVTD